jgi:UDP-N-acetyl-D-mannosaminuronic acid dehydrogenase
MLVQFMGLGYIGLPTAALVASKGIQVHGVDIQKSVIDTLNGGSVHIVEPGLGTLVHRGISDGYFVASDTPSQADIHLIVVPTPFKGDHEPDISFVESATKMVIPFLKRGDTFIIESTSPIGTTEHIAAFIIRERPELEGKIYVAYCPERVLPGNIIHELEHNDRVIGGIDEASTEKAKEFYRCFVKGELFGTNARTAELCKLTENSSRDVQIAFANELSLICDKAGINVWELISLANRHPRVNILQPGSGVGGHCIAVDPWFIVSDYPHESRMIGTAREINNYKASWCAEKIRNTILEFELTQGRKPVVALMGLAFKPNIDDLRESPAMYIAQTVMQSEQDNVLVVEPNLDSHSVFKLTTYKDAYQKADVIAFLVAHDEFRQLDFRESAVILDFVGIFQHLSAVISPNETARAC